MNLFSQPTNNWRLREEAKIRLHVARASARSSGTLDYPRQHDSSDQWELEQVKQALLNLRRSSPPPIQKGLALDAYISEIDDSAQPFWRYIPELPDDSPAPLLVYLHGYNPFLTLATANPFPLAMTNLANKAGAMLVAPFGRGNTDYQHIGEQDVLRVVDEMHLRYNADTNRVVLSGNSMGGLGVWCIGARWPERFNALLAFCGRGDFYVWHDLKPKDIPEWHRRLVDTQFASLYLERLINMPILAVHGKEDETVSLAQGRYPVDRIRAMGGKNAFLLAFNYIGHDVLAYTWYHPTVQKFLFNNLRIANPKAPPRPHSRPGEAGSRLLDLFLEPFIMVGGSDGGSGTSKTNLANRADEWRRFAFAYPRTVMEDELEPARIYDLNLLVFGEPETSPLVRRILEDGNVKITEEYFVIDGQQLPRERHGLYFAGTNPFNNKKIAAVQCGIPWGNFASDNHFYDRLPDIIHYANEADRWGYNIAVAAGFINQGDKSVSWSDPPYTEALKPLPPPILDHDYLFPEWLYDESPF